MSTFFSLNWYLSLTASGRCGLLGVVDGLESHRGHPDGSIGGGLAIEQITFGCIMMQMLEPIHPMRDNNGIGFPQSKLSLQTV